MKRSSDGRLQAGRRAGAGPTRRGVVAAWLALELLSCLPGALLSLAEEGLRPREGEPDPPLEGSRTGSPESAG